jgi:hypothetical protein
MINIYEKRGSMKFPFSANKNDWSSFFGDRQELTRKQALIEECRKKDVLIYIDDVPDISLRFSAIYVLMLNN